MDKVEEILQERIDVAAQMILDYGWEYGSYHKQWVLDQVLRILMGSQNYEAWRESVRLSEFDWDEGIAPQLE